MADHAQASRSPALRSEAGEPAAQRPAAQRLTDTAATLNAGAPVVAQRALAERLAVPVQRLANRTGLPDRLKMGVEALSRIAMDDVRVHRNSSAPAQLNAHAYAQGTDIHLAPGQDHHLPHEAWHVVQQKQGRVRATMQMKAGVPVNDDSTLEAEADAMGGKALSVRPGHADAAPVGASPAQRRAFQRAKGTVWPAPGKAALDTHRVKQCAAAGAMSDKVVQRVVRHKIINRRVWYYSTLEPGKPHYATFADAKKANRKYAKNKGAIRNALYRFPRKTKKNPNPRKVPRRGVTPYAYNPKMSASAAASTTKQGPHSISFSSQEYRIGKRMQKGQHGELARQVISPEAFELLMDKERGNDWDGSGGRERMLLDYNSLHKRFLKLHAGGSRSKGSEYHLVLRDLLQMHPYTTYGKDVKSKGNGERRKSRFGSNSIDSSAYSSVKDKAELERYYDLRKDLYHSSDEETDTEGHAPYKFRKIVPTPKFRETPPDDDGQDTKGEEDEKDDRAGTEEAEDSSAMITDD